MTGYNMALHGALYIVFKILIKSVSRGHEVISADVRKAFVWLPEMSAVTITA